MSFLRKPLSVLLIIFATFIFTACGSSDKSKSAVESKPDTVKPKDPDTPTSDSALTKAVGKELKPLTTAGCLFGVFKTEKPDHVTEDKLRWKTFPPNSGRHLERWVSFGEYDKPVPDGYAVHNLEHGGVVAWFGEGVSKEQAKGINALLDKGDKWLTAPRKDLNGLVVNAWSKSLVCSETALEKIPATTLASAVDAWYEAVVSTGSPQEKDLPAYPGSEDNPSPSRDISIKPS